MRSVRVKSLVGVSRKGEGCVKEAAPKGWVSSREVAERLQVSSRAARAWMSRNGVRGVLAKEPGAGVMSYWEPVALRRALRKRGVLEVGIPAGWCCSYEACCILGVARSSLCRYVEQGLLESRKVRVKSSTGARVVSIFCRAHVRGLLKKRKAVSRSKGRLHFERNKKSWENIQNRRAFIQLE